MENEITKKNHELMFKFDDDDRLKGKYHTDDYGKRHDTTKSALIIKFGGNELMIAIADYYPWMDDKNPLPEDSYRALHLSKIEVLVLIDELIDYKNKMNIEP